ncbi:polysaccharide lyase 8 family protein [Spirillospora sp. CA-294931]|uniref:polysaccharide lyase 8 family protein n=1 Tax=Spirillospora sp. CA-294931 TaxID=3240042 RepID=UPI003D93B4C9
MDLTRRTLLAAGAGGLLLPIAGRAHAAGADEFATLRLRAAELATGGAIDPGDPVLAPAIAKLDRKARGHWTTLDRSASRIALWPDLTPLTSGMNIWLSYDRLAVITTAWATPGTGLYRDETVAGAVTEGLAFLNDRAYNPSAKETGNWWPWEIGAPQALMATCVLLLDRVPAERIAAYCAAVDRFCPNPDRRTNLPSYSETGANRADKAAIVALRGIVGRDAGRLVLARDGLSDTRDSGRNSLFKLVTSGDGFYADGSFIQHEHVAYTGSYGNVLLGRIAYLAALLAGSTWKITDPGIGVIHRAVERSFAATTLDGLSMDAVRGRAISRAALSDADAGAATTTAMLLLATAAPREHADRWKAIAKGWIRRNTDVPYLSIADVPAIRRAQAVLADRDVPSAPSPIGHTVFADMDRVVHRRPDWTLALSLSSKRIAAYEAGNGENLHGWHTGDGMTYLYHRDRTQFSDAFWPTVDPYRLPGTTADTRRRPDTGPGYRLPVNAVAGGAVLRGRFGAAAMDLAALDSTLRARKAWFCLDDAVVALGAGITASDGRAVETVVENRNLHAAGTNRLTVDGSVQPGERGWTRTFDEARWAHLEGVGGYVFPEGAALHALREERTGAWSDINTSSDWGSTERLTRRYATLWFDHGVSPAGATYAYVLLPGAGKERTAAWARYPRVRVLANTARVQAVECRGPELVAAHFWAAGEAGGIVTDGPGTVLVQRGDEGVSVAVADPGRTAAALTVELPWPARRVKHADPSVSVTIGRRPRLTVAVGGSRGHTHTATLI